MSRDWIAERPAGLSPSEAAPRLAAAFANGIAAVDAAEWDACAAGDGPFLSHAYLAAAEDSGMAAAANGWVPLHLTIRDAQARLVAVAPVYLKSHSNDEYWLDQLWAVGYAQAGGRYYPKLLVGVPFAPVSGRRLLLHPAAPAGVAGMMIGLLEQLAGRFQCSSIHATFPDDADRGRLAEAGWLVRHDIQYEWSNPGYRDFADFLDALTAKKRQKIRRERRFVAADGVRFRDVAGDRMAAGDVAAFLHLLDDLHRRRRTPQPLTAAFLHRLGAALGARLVLSFAEIDGVPAGALLQVAGDRRLYIRNWGCLAGHRFLHFEACYYRVVAQAIERGCEAVEGGYGGPHKLERGFLPKLTHSLHWFGHRNLRAAVAGHLAQERKDVLDAFARQRAGSPFRQGR